MSIIEYLIYNRGRKVKEGDGRMRRSEGSDLCSDGLFFWEHTYAFAILFLYRFLFLLLLASSSSSYHTSRITQERVLDIDTIAPCLLHSSLFLLHDIRLLSEVYERYPWEDHYEFIKALRAFEAFHIYQHSIAGWLVPSILPSIHQTVS